MKQFEFILRDDLAQAEKEANEEMRQLQLAGASIILVDYGVHPIPNSQTVYSFLILYDNPMPPPVQPHITVRDAENHKRKS